MSPPNRHIYGTPGTSFLILQVSARGAVIQTKTNHGAGIPTMKLSSLILFAALVAASPASLAIAKCVTPSGDTIFTDHGCPAGSKPRETITYQSRPSTGLRAGERRMLNRIEAREANERAAKQYERERSSRHHVGYSDRKKIRELEMEKRTLSKSLSRGKKTYGQTTVIRSQIHGLNRQIEQLRAPKW